MTKKGLRKTLAPLAGLLPALSVGMALATPAERPRPENFDNYSYYVQALVDYQRAQEALAATRIDSSKNNASDAKLCRDDNQSENGKNNCEGKYLLGKDVLEDDASRDQAVAAVDTQEMYESLDETIARAGFAGAPASTDAGAMPRSTFHDFPLQEIPSQDLSESGVDGLLGLFDNVRLRGVTSNNTGNTTASGSATLDPDGSLRASLDNVVLDLSDENISFLGNTVFLRNGYAIASADVSINGSGLDIELSSEVRTSLYIVDRDGLPGSRYAGAGAITVDELGIRVPHLDVNLQGVRTTSDSGLFRIAAYSPQPIYVDLTDTRIGVADALADGSYIGTSTDALVFGPQSVLTIGAGTNVVALIDKPDGINTAFVTLNGHVGDLSLSDISLLDNDSGGGIRVGKLAVRNLELEDTRVFMDERKVIVDLGTGIRDLEVDIERLYLGSESRGNFVGDFYADGGHLRNLRFTATPH